MKCAKYFSRKAKALKGEDGGEDGGGVGHAYSIVSIVVSFQLVFWYSDNMFR